MAYALGMGALLRRYWVIAAIIGLELVWTLLIHLRARAYRGNPAMAADNDAETIPLRGWRLMDLAYILYHFPVLLTVTSLRRKNAVPGWVLRTLTPVVYSALALLALRIWG